MSFFCEICNYKTEKKADYNKHINTKKHLKKCNIELLQNVSKNENEKNYNFCCIKCNLNFKSRTTLWRHKKKSECINKEYLEKCLKENISTSNELSNTLKNTLENTLSNNSFSNDLLKELVEQNKEILKQMKEMSNEPKVVNNYNNTNNNQFNLNLFTPEPWHLSRISQRNLPLTDSFKFKIDCL